MAILVFQSHSVNVAVIVRHLGAYCSTCKLQTYVVVYYSTDGQYRVLGTEYYSISGLTQYAYYGRSSQFVPIARKYCRSTAINHVIERKVTVLMTTTQTSRMKTYDTKGGEN
jgi:hypothetical protein